MTIHSEIAAAERAGDAALLAAIARQLLAEGRSVAPKAAKKPKADAPKDHELLTRTERIALGLPVKTAKLDKDGPYQWALASFGNGLRMQIGFYPRVKEPWTVTVTRAARARYLLAVSGGRLIDPKKAKHVPRVVDVRLQTACDEIENERWSCMRMGSALDAFTGQAWRDFERAQAWRARQSEAVS